MAKHENRHYDNWIKSFSKAVGSTTKEVLRTVTPNIASTVDSASDSLKSARSYLAHAKSGLNYQSRTLETTRMGRSAKDIMESAFADLRNGTFSLKNLRDDSYDVDLSIDIDNDTSSTSDSAELRALNESRKNTTMLGKVVAEGNAAQIEGMREMTGTLASVTLKTAEASSSKLANIALFGVNKLSADISGVQNSLNTINANLVEMINFQNQNTSVANQAAIEYYSKTTGMLYEIGKTLSSMKDATDNMQKMSIKRDFWLNRGFDIFGGMNFRDYGSFVRRNFENSLIGSMFSMAGTAKDMVGSFGGMGLGKSLITQVIASLAIPSAVKKSLGVLDKNSDRYIRNLLYRIGDLGDYSNTNMITQFIGEVFGMKRPDITKINLGNFKKDYMGWNGVAQKTLVEVIPSYLASIESSLSKQEKRFYDMDRGIFRTESQITNQFESEYQSKLQFGMMKVVDDISKKLNETDRSAEDKERTALAISNIIQDRIFGLRKNDKNYSEEMHNLLQGLSVKDIREIMLDLEDSIRDTIDSINNMNRSIENDISGSVYRNLMNTEGADISNLRKRSNLFKHEKFSRSGKAYSSMTEEEILKDERAKETEEKIKSKIKKFKDKFSRRKEKKSSWMANKVEDFDNFLYNLYTKLSTGDMSFDSFKKMYTDMDSFEPEDDLSSDISSAKIINIDRKRSNKTYKSADINTEPKSPEEEALDKEISAAESKMVVYNQSRLSKMTQNEVDDLGRKSGKIMSSLKKLASNRNFDKETAATQEEAIIKIANEVPTSNRSLKSLVAGLFSSLSSMIGGVFGRNGLIGRFFGNNKVKDGIALLKKKLFDEESGLFAPVVRAFKDGVDYMKYVFTGKGYTNRKGKTYSDTNDSVFGHLKNGYTFIFDNVMKHVFGDDYQSNKTYNKFFKWMNLNKNKNRGSITEEDIHQLEARTLEEKIVQDGVFGDSDNSTIDTSTEKVQSRLALQSTALATANVRDQVEAKILNAADITAERMIEAGDNLALAIYGDIDSSNNTILEKKASESFFSKFKKNLPKMLAAGIVGGGIGLLGKAGGLGVLGNLFLPGGVISGVIAGMGLQLASKSQKFQEFVFGKDDGNGERTGGLISKQTTDTFKKLLPAIVGGATLGALKKAVVGGAVVSGPGGFLLNTLLPGGILGGALLGAGISLLKNNEKFNKILFGKDADEDGNNSKTTSFVSKGFGKMKSAFSKSAHFIKGGLKGLAIGAISGLTLSQLGLVGSALSLGGPIGMGIAGLGIGIALQTNRFQELLFGTKEIGPDGKPTGKVFKDGIMHQVRNMLVINVFEPVRDQLNKEMTKFAYWAKDKIMYPFRLAFGPLLDSMKDFKDDFGDFVKEKFEKLTDGIGSAIKGGIEKMFSPFTKLLGMVGKGILKGIGYGARAALFPITGGLNIVSALMGGKRSRERLAFLKNTVTTGFDNLRDIWDEEDTEAKYGTGIIGNIRKFAGRARDIKDAYNTSRDAWNEQMTRDGRNSLNWRNVRKEKKQDKIDLANEKVTSKMWKNVNKLRSKYMKEDNYKEVYWSDKRADEMRKKFIAAGVDESWIRTNDDLRELIYDREKWKAKWNPNKPNTESTAIIPIQETPEQEEARKRTSAFQDEVLHRFDKIYDAMTEAAASYNTERRRSEGAKEVEKAKKALKRKGLKVEDLGISDDELMEYDDIPSYEWDNYRASEFYEKKDFKGWYERNKVRFGRFNEYDYNDKSASTSEAIFNQPYSNSTEERAYEGYTTQDVAQILIDKLDEFIESQNEQNETLTGVAEILSGGEWDSEERVISDEKAAIINTSTEEYEEAQSKGFLKGLKSFFGIKERKDKRAAQIAREQEESKHAQALGDKAEIVVDDIDGSEITIDGEKESKKEKTSLIDKIKGFFGWFSKTGNWIKLLAGAGVSYLFKDQIIDGLDALPQLVEKYAPKIQSVFSNFMDNYGEPIIKAATNSIVTLMPSLVESAFTITTSLFKEVFGSVANSLGIGKKSKTVDASEAESLDEAGINYIINDDGTLTIPGANTYFDQDGNMRTIGNSRMQEASVKLARNMLASKTTRKAVTTVAGKTVKTIAKVATSPLKLIPGGKVISNTVTSGAEAVIKTTGKATDAVISAATSTSGKARLVKWCMEVFDKFDKITTNPKIAKVIDGNILGKGIKKVKDIIMKALVKADDKLASKLAAKAINGTAKATGKLVATSTLIVPALFMIYDAATGAMEAENLFGVDSDEVDWKMKVISSLMKTILGLGVGPFIDILFEIGGDLTGIDFKKQFATFLYELWADDDDVAKLKANQENLEIETRNYNDANGTNLTAKAYNELKNSPWWKKAWNWITGKESEDFSKYEVQKYSTQTITETPNGSMYVNTVGNNNQTVHIRNRSITNNRSAAIGYGPNRRHRIIPRSKSTSIGYGTTPVLGVSQSDPRWKDYPLGYFPDGSVSTMATGGCGPTALSMVGTALSENKNYDPLSIAKYAKANGYLTDGGANEELFTEGAERLGLKPSKVTVSNLKKAVQSGEPVILAGKSNGEYENTPYTKAGHIIVASDYNPDTDKVVISDPMYGFSQERDLYELSAGMTHAWKYSAKKLSGYGREMSKRNRRRKYIGFGNYAAIHGTQTNTYMEAYNEWKNNGGDDSYIDTSSGYDKVYNKYFNDSWILSSYKFDDKKLPMTFKDYFKVLDRISSAISSGSYPEINRSNLPVKADSIINWFTGNRISGRSGYDFAIGDIMYKAARANYPSSFQKYVNLYWNRPLTKDEYDYVAMTMSSQGTGLVKYDDSDLTSAKMIAVYKALRGEGTADDNALLYKYDSTFAESAGILSKSLNEAQIKQFYEDGFQLNSDGIMNFNDPNYYLGLRNDDIYSIGKRYPELISEDYPLFREIYRNFMGKPTLVKYIPKAIRDGEVAVLDENLLGSLAKRASLVPMLGKSYSLNDYFIKNGFPFFSIYDKRWSKLKWGSGNMETYGSDIASLAMVASAFGNHIISPEYILQNWIPKNKHWWNLSNGLTSAAFGPNGFKAMTSTYVDGQPLNVEKLTNTSSILTALQERKPVYMTGYRYDGSIFGGYEDKTKVSNLNRKSSRNSIVAVYSDGNTIAVNDPMTEPDEYSLFDSAALNDMVTKSQNIPAVKEAYVITKPDGTGLDSNVDYNSKTGPTSKHKKLSDYKGLEKLSALISNFVSIGENLLASKFNDEDYQSIYNVSLDDNYTGDKSVQNTQGIDDNNIGNGLGMLKSIGYGPGYRKNRVIRRAKKLGIGGGNKTIGYGENAAGIGRTSDDDFENFSNKLQIIYGAKMAELFGGEKYESAKKRLETEMLNKTSDNAPDTTNANSAQIGQIGQIGQIRQIGTLNYSGGSELARTAANIIFAHESRRDTYQAINGNDNGAISIGRLQWHANRARNLLVDIRNSDPTSFDSIASRNNAATLTDQIKNRRDWSRYTVVSGSPTYKAIREILGTSVSKTIQDKTAINNVETYISRGKSLGLTDPQALIYFADFANQFGEYSSKLTSVTNRAVANGGTLDAMYEATKYVLGTNSEYFRRRSEVYNEIKAAYGASSNNGTNLRSNSIGYGYGNSDYNTPASWFVNTLNGTISSSFGLRTPYGDEYHRGIDISTSSGTPIYSPIAGEVIESGFDPAGYGNYVVVKDFKGYKHLFGHMNSKSPVENGTIVAPNTLLGYVGNTGDSTGSHLHYEIRTGNSSATAIDPNTFTYDNTTVESIADTMLSKSLNINQAAVNDTDNVSKPSKDLGYGNGQRDISSDIIVKKLDVAVKTDGVEKKLDILIDVLKDFAERDRKPIVTNNNSASVIAYGNGKNRPVSQMTIIQTPSKEDNVDYGSMGIKSIHDLIARKK